MGLVCLVCVFFVFLFLGVVWGVDVWVKVWLLLGVFLLWWSVVIGFGLVWKG